MANSEDSAFQLALRTLSLPNGKHYTFFFKFRGPSYIALKIGNIFVFICYYYLIKKGRKVSDIIIELDISTSLCKAG